MSSQEGSVPKEIEFDQRNKTIDQLRRHPIVRKGKDFKLLKSDIAPTTWGVRLLVFVVGAITGFGLLWLSSWPLALLIPTAQYNQLVRIEFVLLVLVLPIVVSLRFYVTNPWDAWGIETLGKLSTVKSGKIFLLPLVNSVRGILTLTEKTLYVPVNQGAMRGIKGQSSVRVSLNATVPYKAGRTSEERKKLFLAVQDPDVSLFMMAEGAVTGWMRERPFTALIESKSLKAIRIRVMRLLENLFPGHRSEWYHKASGTILGVVYSRGEVENLDDEEAQRKSPGEEIAEALSGKVKSWGLSIRTVELTDIGLPPKMAQFFERSEAINEMIANIDLALREQYPNQEENWYRDAALPRLDNLIIYAEGERPTIIRTIGGADPFGR